jgi:hypothetical protein
MVTETLELHSSDFPTLCTSLTKIKRKMPPVSVRLSGSTIPKGGSQFSTLSNRHESNIEITVDKQPVKQDPGAVMGQALGGPVFSDLSF